jgi:hypothetical protein
MLRVELETTRSQTGRILTHGRQDFPSTYADQRGAPMNMHGQSPDASEIEKFRNAHKVWKEASDRFHDRFQAIVSGSNERGKELEALSQDLMSKLDHFMACSKAFITWK